MVLTEFHGSVKCTWCHWGPHEGLAEGPPGGSSTPPWWWPPGRADYLCHWVGGTGPSPPYCPTPPGYASASEHTQSDIYVEKYREYTLIHFTCVFIFSICIFYTWFQLLGIGIPNDNKNNNWDEISSWYGWNNTALLVLLFPQWNNYFRNLSKTYHSENWH